jgi:uncharacterized protein
VHIDTVLLKVASRCNLDCDYCYVYNMGDASWRSLPKRMSTSTEVAVVNQLDELRKAQKRPFSIVLHGGEPLLLGHARLRDLFGRLRHALGPSCGISVQTNGVLVTNAILEVCVAYGITLSVSLDGPATVHDRFRKDRRHRPTHQAVLEGIAKLKSHAHSGILFSGILAVVDPSTDPAGVYQFFKDLGVPSVDFLYRDGNHANLPYGKASSSSLEYGSWMSRILDLYIADPSPFRIRLIDAMMKLLLGGIGVKEGIGLTDYGILVIDTDGSIKKNDTLKSSPLGDRFGSAWDIHEHRLSEIARSNEFVAYHKAQRPTSIACLSCEHLRVCGGGMLTHRFKEETGYDNPTVFCADQQFLIERMKRHIANYRLRHGSAA